MKAFTPGPWSRKDPLSRDTFITAGDDDIAVALFDDVGEQTARANARLIAQAPDLFAFVERMAVYFKANPGGYDDMRDETDRLIALVGGPPSGLGAGTAPGLVAAFERDRGIPNS